MVQILEARPQRCPPNLTLHCGANLVELDAVATVATPRASKLYLQTMRVERITMPDLRASFEKHWPIAGFLKRQRFRGTRVV